MSSNLPSASWAADVPVCPKRGKRVLRVWFLRLIASCMVVLGGCAPAEKDFVPPRLDLGNATLVSLDSVSDLHSCAPEQLSSTIDAMVRAVPGLSESLAEMASSSPTEYDRWRYIQFRLLQNSSLAKCYGPAWDRIGPYAVAALDSVWHISKDSASVFTDSSFRARYEGYESAVEQFVSTLRSLVDNHPSIHSVYLEVYGASILSLYSERVQQAISLPNSLSVKEEFACMYGGSVIPVEAEEPLASGKWVFVRYFEDEIQLVFGYYPEGGSPYDLLVVLDSPVKSRLSDRQ